MKDKLITIRASESYKKRIEKAADYSGISQSQFMIESINERLKRCEGDYMDPGLKRQYKNLLSLLRFYQNEPEDNINKELISICKEEIVEVEKKLAKGWKA